MKCKECGAEVVEFKPERTELSRVKALDLNVGVLSKVNVEQPRFVALVTLNSQAYLEAMEGNGILWIKIYHKGEPKRAIGYLTIIL